MFNPIELCIFTHAHMPLVQPCLRTHTVDFRENGSKTENRRTRFHATPHSRECTLPRCLHTITNMSPPAPPSCRIQMSHWLLKTPLRKGARNPPATTRTAIKWEACGSGVRAGWLVTGRLLVRSEWVSVIKSNILRWKEKDRNRCARDVTQGSVFTAGLHARPALQIPGTGPSSNGSRFGPESGVTRPLL